MLVSPINSINYSNNSILKNSKNNACQQQKNINFGSVSSWLLYCAAKEGVSTITKTNRYKFVKELCQHVKSWDENKFTLGIQALTKTPNSYYSDNFSKIGIISFFDEPVDYIKDLRWEALKKLYLIKDTSYINIQTKKDFIMSLFENGHPISPKFTDVFQYVLDDKIYWTFKQHIIDTALYSTSYNSKRSNSEIWYNRCNYVSDDTKYDDMYEWTYAGLRDKVHGRSATECASFGNAYQNLKLIERLDRSIYGNFISQRRNSINQMKEIVEKGIKYSQNCHPGLWEYSQETQAFYNDFINNLKTL